MNNVLVRQIAMGVVGFLVTWQATNFALDYRAVLSSIVSFALGGASPKKTA
jgi:hypothetical protein